MLKTKAKYLIVILLFLVALILFNTSTVNAIEFTGDEEWKVLIPNEIEKDMIVELDADILNKGINVSADPFVLWNLSKNTTKLDSIVSSDGKVYQEIYVEIPNNVIEIINKTDDKKFTVEQIDGKNYMKYDMPILEKKGSNYLPNYYWTDYKLEFKDSENQTVAESFKIYFGLYEGKGYGSRLEIVDENNNYIGEDNGKTMSSWSGGSDTQIFTSYDYSDAYYRLALSQNVGDSIYIDKIGTLKYTGQEVVGNMKVPYYIYKMKITDTSMFNKQQNISFLVEIIDKDTKQGAYNDIQFNILGDTRQTYTVNDESKNIGISINAATDVGVSLKADTIDEADRTYIEMKNVVADNKDYFWIGAYDIKLVGGNYEGDLLLTFDLGEENNGKKVYIVHKLNNGDFEYFYEVVESGKVTIKVTELSPFLLAYEEQSTGQTGGQSEQSTTNETSNETNNEATVKGEKDNTPKTGTDNTVLNSFGLITVLGSAALITKIFVK